MFYKILLGVLLPFFGTSLGASSVFFLRKGLSPFLSDILNGFAAGVMLAASIWSLLIPSFSYSNSAIIPLIGFWMGFMFLFLLEKLLSLFSFEDGPNKIHHGTLLLILAVALHNLPEGIAVGVVFAEYLIGGNSSLYALAFAFSIGITIQNIPEGAIISCPLYASGVGRTRSFALGVLSGVIEPLGAAVALVSLGASLALLPLLLSLTAGAMICVTIKSLVPEFLNRGSLFGITAFFLGFSVMMLLDVYF